MKKLMVKTMSVDSLTESLKNEMWKLYESTYDFVNYQQFLQDLAKKNYVFIGFDKKSGAFKGFSTVWLYSTNYQNQKIGVIFSGDTIIHPDYWGSKALHKEFIRFAYSWKIKNLTTPLYWNLIASGNRTYLAMARNCATYYPRYDQETPEWERGFINHIGTNQFGDRFNTQSGIIIVDKPEAVFKSSLAPFTETVKAIPEIKFFIEQNKGYEKGDELSCIAKLDLKFITNFLSVFVSKKIAKTQISDLIPARTINVLLAIASVFKL